MDSLVSKKTHILDDFYLNKILPLVLYGCGSIHDILEMKIYEITEALACTQDKNFQKSFMTIHGLQIK